MGHAQIICEMIQHTKHDFISYFRGTHLSQKAEFITELALSGDDTLASMRSELESIIPDTKTDGSWECSYSLNTGSMILNLIDYQYTENEKHYDDAVTVFFDAVDFKVQQDLERQGISRPTEAQTRNHEVFVLEKAWFHQLVTNLSLDELHN